MNSARHLVAVVVVLASCGDREPSQPTISRPSGRDLQGWLSDQVPPWSAGPVTGTTRVARRTYSRGGVVLDAMIARRPMIREDYERWALTALEWPSPDLDLDPRDGAAFLDCNEQAAGCDIHVQLVAGFHVEVMGRNGARRAEVEALAREILAVALPAARAAQDVPDIGPITDMGGSR